MIRPLRRRHTLLAIAMTAGLPLLVIYRMLDPSPTSWLNSLPRFSQPDEVRFPIQVWKKDYLWKMHPEIQTRLLSSADGSDLSAVELHFQTPPKHGELLLYWSTFPPDDTPSLDDAYLLGVVGGIRTVFSLPDLPRNRDGTLILYSLASRSIVSEAPLLNPTPRASAGMHPQAETP